MKRVFLITFFVFALFAAQSQTELYTNIASAIKQKYPEVLLADELLAVNFWSLQDQRARDLNKAFAKNYATYQFAKLKGGRQGMHAVSVNIDGQSSEATIILYKDGAEKLIQLSLSDLNLKSAVSGNVLFDSTGNEITRDIPADKVFTTINHLTTR